MKKNKQPQAGKKKPSSGRASKSFRKVGRSLSQLSTTQKVVGGTLLALGLGYVAKRRSKGLESAPPAPSDQVAE